MTVLARHGWYLVPQMIPFSLFSSKLDEDSKSRVASRILSFEDKKPAAYSLVKPTFPTISPTTQLTDLVGPDSFMFFHILGLDYEWLRVSPSKWEASQSFKEAKEFVVTVKVVNDCAERGIKMISDYALILTNDEDMRVRMLQGVEYNRYDIRISEEHFIDYCLLLIVVQEKISRLQEENSQRWLVIC